MRPISSCIAAAFASLILTAGGFDPVAAAGFSHGPGLSRPAGPVLRGAVRAHRPIAVARAGSHFRHGLSGSWRRHQVGHHRHAWPWAYGASYGPWGSFPWYAGSGSAPLAPAIIDQPAMAPPGPPTVLDLPAATGIATSPAAPPVIYVLHAPGGGHGGAVHKGHHRPGAKIVARERLDAAAETVPGGPRIIHLRVPRG